MSCTAITCPTFANPEFMAQVVIATVRSGGTYSFGNFKAGIYRVAYLQGANRWNAVWQALSGDSQTMTLHICDGKAAITITKVAFAFSQAGAEANAAGVAYCFEHTGGDISIEFSSASYASNQNGAPNATFNLFRDGSAIPPSPPQPIPAIPFSNQSYSLFHCAEKVTCDGVDLPVRNFSSEAVDIPSEPTLPGGVVSLPSNPPVAGGSQPPVIPLPISPETGGGSAIVQVIPPDPGPAPPIPPDPPPPPPMTSFDCVDGTCVDPGDGSGEFATLEECSNNCVPTPPPPPPCTEITVSGPIQSKLFIADGQCDCSQEVHFYGTNFPNHSSLSFGGCLSGTIWALQFIDTTHLVLSAASACAIASEFLNTTGAGTYGAHIVNSGSGEIQGEYCCALSVEISICACVGPNPNYVFSSVSPSSIALDTFYEFTFTGSGFNACILNFVFDNGSNIFEAAVATVNSGQIITQTQNILAGSVGVYHIKYVVGASQFDTGLTVTCP